MCGLFGWQIQAGAVKDARMYTKLRDLANCLRFANDDRGGDSWGYFDGYELVKDTGEISAANIMLHNKQFVMAHTRFATVGNITAQNAHPFRVGKIIGAHNGVVHNFTALKTAAIETNQPNFEVDSQFLLAELEKTVTTIGKAPEIDLEHVQAYGALTWTANGTMKNRVVYLARFNGGELAIASINGPDNRDIGVVWSSAQSALYRALCIAGFDFTFYRVKENQVYFATRGLLYEPSSVLKVGRKQIANLGAFNYQQIALQEEGPVIECDLMEDTTLSPEGEQK